MRDARATSSAPRRRSATRSTGSTPTPSTSPTSTRAPTRCARRASTTTSRRGASSSGRAATRTRGTARYTAVRAAPAGRRPAVPRQLEQQAGQGSAAPTPTPTRSVYRSLLLEDRLKRRIAGAQEDDAAAAGRRDGGRGHDRPARARGPAARAARSSAAPSDPRVAQAVDQAARLARRRRPRRIDRDRDGAYEHADAIRDHGRVVAAWLEAQFQPALGPDAFDAAARGTVELDNAPNNHGDHLGSAYQDGWYGYVSKDLRTVAAAQGQAAATRARTAAAAACRAAGARCGASLRAALRSTARRALPAATRSARRGQAGDQWCFDAVRFRPLGGATQPLIPWINRPDLPAGDRDPGPPAALSAPGPVADH